MKSDSGDDGLEAPTQHDTEDIKREALQLTIQHYIQAFVSRKPRYIHN